MIPNKKLYDIKNKRTYLGLLLCLNTLLCGLLTSCSEDEEYTPYKDTLEAMYPDMVYAIWYEDHGMFRARTSDYHIYKTVWFTPEGEWVMTQHDISYDDLPLPIRESFEGSKYQNYTLKNVYHYEQPGIENTYVISLYQDFMYANLYYRENGELYRESSTRFCDFIPSIFTRRQDELIKQHYHNAAVLESRLYDEEMPEYRDESPNWYLEEGDICVVILHNGIYKEVSFDADEWSVTRWVVPVTFETLRPQIQERLNMILEDMPEYSLLGTAIYEDLPTGNDTYLLRYVDQTGENNGYIRIDLNGHLIKASFN